MQSCDKVVTKTCRGDSSIRLAIVGEAADQALKPGFSCRSPASDRAREEKLCGAPELFS